MANKLPPVATFCKSRVCIVAMLWVLSVLLTGCQSEVEIVEPTPNPSPKKVYEITVTVENAPAGFTSAEGEQWFGVNHVSRNSQPACLPWPLLANWPSVPYERASKINYQRIGPTSFEARVVLDPYTPKDDYGLGICTWYPTTHLVSLNNGTNTHSIYMEQWSDPWNEQEQKMKFAYRIDEFLQDKYPATGQRPVIQRGALMNESSDLDKYKFPSDEYFYITVVATKVSA